MDNGNYGQAPPPMYSSNQLPPPMPYQPQPQPTYINNTYIPPQQQQQQPAQVVIVQQPQRQQPQVFALSSSPMGMTCPKCNMNIITRVERDSGMFTWLISGGICLVGCFFPILWFGCCLIPFCMDDFKDTKHFCPNCNNYFGIHTR